MKKTLILSFMALIFTGCGSSSNNNSYSGIWVSPEQRNSFNNMESFCDFSANENGFASVDGFRVDASGNLSDLSDSVVVGKLSNKGEFQPSSVFVQELSMESLINQQACFNTTSEEFYYYTESSVGNALDLEVQGDVMIVSAQSTEVTCTNGEVLTAEQEAYTFFQVRISEEELEEMIEAANNCPVGEGRGTSRSRRF